MRDACVWRLKSLHFFDPIVQAHVFKIMAITPIPRPVADLKPKFEVKVDLDDRAFLFPAGKSVSQLLFLSDGRKIYVEAVFPFNQSHTPPRLVSLDLEDAKELGRRLVAA